MWVGLFGFVSAKIKRTWRGICQLLRAPSRVGVGAIGCESTRGKKWVGLLSR